MTIYVFDAYDTIFDISSTLQKCATTEKWPKFRKKWASVAHLWREKQLEYSWLLNAMRAHVDFWQITNDALDYSLAMNQIDDDKLRARLLELFDDLEVFEEVPEVLEALSAHSRCAILSNGTMSMLQTATRNAGIRKQLEGIISVDEIGIFKPSGTVYNLVSSYFECHPSEVVFVSGNSWDAAGASKFGFRTVWVNRNNVLEEQLPWTADATFPDLRFLMEVSSNGELRI